MRHKYETRSLILSRTHVGEATTYVTLLTSDLGLIYARAQSLRKPGAKLAHALTTFAESSCIVVRGKDGWRVTGAILEESWTHRLVTLEARVRAGRVSQLLLRLVAGEERDRQLFPIVTGLLEALAVSSPADHEAVEVLAVLRILSALGLDAGDIPGEPQLFSASLLAEVGQNRKRYVNRVNNGIVASGL